MDLHGKAESVRGESGMYCIVVNEDSVFGGAELQTETCLFVVNRISLRIP